ncbi:hypothetical protein [Citrifermentans bemidjiense]|nr:hypothetical protein [Citrifermentans bemidjiense]
MTVASDKTSLAALDAGVHLHCLPQELFFSPRHPAAATRVLAW